MSPMFFESLDRPPNANDCVVIVETEPPLRTRVGLEEPELLVVVDRSNRLSDCVRKLTHLEQALSRGMT